MPRSPLVRIPRLLPLLAAALAWPAAGGAATATPGAVMKIAAAADVAAPPSAVWSYVTTGRNFVTWCPAWKNPANAAISLRKVGDSVDYMDAYGNGGRSIVTFLMPGKEIRVAHEPANGSYVCQARFVLTAAGAGTHIEATDQYTDDSTPDERKATAEKAGAEMDRMLAALKSALEGKPR